MTLNLFEDITDHLPQQELLAPSAMLLRRFALSDQHQLLADLDAVISLAPLRHMFTPGGHRMSVTTASCGALGWVSSKQGYRYSANDPDSGKAWPAIPASFLTLAQNAAANAGFQDFAPDACLINRYESSAKMSLHQDKDETDFSQPIVSVSLGIPAIFLFGGFERSDRAQRVLLNHGDVVVWGGESRLRFHGIMPLKESVHPLLGRQRINLTFRKAG